MPRQRAESILQQMLDTMRHESFYTTGTWSDESLGMYVGWCARAGSFSDAMPLRNERGDLVLAFSGEEYADREVIDGLRSAGHQFPTDGPSYLVHLAEDDAFPQTLNGKFHGFLIDRTQGTGTLFNDRFGMHRLYYHEARDGVYFAAEAKAILAVRPELRTVNPRALAELISCGSTLENRTLFDQIHVLPCAARWTFRHGALERRSSYFEPSEWEAQATLEPDAYYRQLRETFARVLPRYFGGSERIGMSLTGGLDSRMIMAWQRSAAGSLPCYSFRGAFRECEDFTVAARVARTCGQAHERIMAGEEFLAQFPRYAERSVYLSDGCADVSLCPDLYMYERARQIAPVRMTGNFGGEILRRVIALKAKSAAPALFDPAVLGHVETAKDTYARLLDTNPLTFAAFRQGPWHFSGVLALEQAQLASRTPYLDNDLVRTVYRAPASALIDNEMSLRLIADGNAGLRSIPTDRGVGGRGLSGALSKHALSLTFKAEYAFDYGMPQWLARLDSTFSPLRLERLFLGRHKFYHFRTWYKNALAPYVKEILLDRRTLARPYLQRRHVEAVVNTHVSGRGNYTSEIHKLLTLELLHRQLVDGSAVARSLPSGRGAAALRALA